MFNIRNRGLRLEVFHHRIVLRLCHFAFIEIFDTKSQSQWNALAKAYTLLNEIYYKNYNKLLQMHTLTSDIWRVDWYSKLIWPIYTQPYVYVWSKHTGTLSQHNHMGVSFSHGHKTAHIPTHAFSAQAAYMSAFYKFQQTLTNNRKSHTYTFGVGTHLCTTHTLKTKVEREQGDKTFHKFS